MALIVDPDDLSQGLETAVSDAAFTSSSGADTVITSGGNLPTLTAGDFFEVRDHSVPGNNGLYIATGSPTASNLPCTKVEGTDPTDQTAEAIRTLGDNGAASEYKSVHIDTGLKRIYLIEKGNLSTDGVTGQALYSFMKEEWKSDADHIKYAFPMVAIGSVAEELEFQQAWEPRTVSSPAIQSKKLIRTAGWSEISTTGYITKQFSGIVTLGTFEDEANDTAYYSLGYDPTDTGAAIDFTFPGPVNEAILVYEDYGVPGNLVISGTDTITKSGGTSFITFGFRVGGSVTIQDAEDSANDGTWVLTAVSADALTVSGTLTNNADDDTMRLAADNRNAVFPKIRVRDADPKGKTFDASSVTAIGFSIIDNKAFRFPLSNKADQFIDETDANIAANSPYTKIWMRYLAGTYNRDVDTPGTQRDFGIVIDVGRYSQSNGVSAGSTLFTSASLSLGATEALSDYTGGTLTIHEGTDKGVHTISGTPVNNAGTLEITLTGALSGSESNLSFTMGRATPLTATAQEIYEKVQYLLRQDSDIDSTGNVVTGRTADAFIDFIGATDIRFGERAPDNPNGGGSGVIVEGFDANDTNNMYFWDNGGTQRAFPFVAAGTIAFNQYLTGDTDPDYWMFFKYITRTTVADLAISAASGDTASIDSSGANLPTVSQYDYFELTDMINEENNGIWLVTDATPTNSQFDAQKVDGATVVNEGSASHPFDWKPAGSPQATLVNDNGGSPITGAVPGGGSVSFDFDYDGNTQGGRSSGTDAAILIRAGGLELGQFAETLGVITRATGLSFSVVSAQERNYKNP